MSGKSIQNTLNRAFNTVGKILGWEFSVYRPTNWLNPVQDANFVGKYTVSTSKDENFVMEDEELTKFRLFINADRVQLGDILHSEELEKTYVVFDKVELRAPLGVLAQDRFNVLRPTLTTGDKPRGFETIGTEIPGALKIAGTSTTDGALKVTTATLNSGSHQIEVWTWVPANFIRINDVLELNDIRYLVNFAQTTGKGTKLRATSTKVTK